MNSSGTPQAFALSLADLIHFSSETGAFPNHRQRAAAGHSWWLLRTISRDYPSTNHAWLIYYHPEHPGRIGELHGQIRNLDYIDEFGGVRPAIIVHQ